MLSFLCSNLFRIVRHHCTLRSEQRMWRWWIFFSTMEHPLMLLIRFAHNSFQLCVLKLNVYFIHLWISKSSGWTWQQKLTRSRFLMNLCFLKNYPYPYQWKFFFLVLLHPSHHPLENPVYRNYMWKVCVLNFFWLPLWNFQLSSSTPH